MVRPTAAELEVAAALIVRMKAADSSIKKADPLLVCAAVACRAGEFGGVPTVCARKMGKDISRPKQVTSWVNRLKLLDQMPAVKSGLLLTDHWIEQNAPGISGLVVGAMQLSPEKRHGKRLLSAESATPLGSMRPTSATVPYTLLSVENER